MKGYGLAEMIILCILDQQGLHIHFIIMGNLSMMLLISKYVTNLMCSNIKLGIISILSFSAESNRSIRKMRYKV